MECDICSRSVPQASRFHCVTCARNSLYEFRLQYVQALVEKEALGRQVQDTVSRHGTEPQTVTQEAHEALLWRLEKLAASRKEASDRTGEIRSHVDVLKAEIARTKAEAAERKQSLLRRRSNFSLSTQGLDSKRATVVEAVEKNINRMNHRWDALHVMTAESRAFLCKEAASLYGLRLRRKTKGTAIKEDYIIGGVSIVDLRDLNTASPVHVTTSITNVARLLVLISQYLSLRLPAEITLPHRDYPLPTIFSPASSYSSRKVSFPGSSGSHSSTGSPSDSRSGDLGPLPRPRPLYLEKPLPALAKEDPGTYALFVEGVSLLAWDIAWLCRTQGMTAINTWEDVCALGRNMCQLLLGHPHQPEPSQTTNSPGDDPSNSTTPREDSLPTHNNGTEAMFGHFSHGTAHSFLASAEGTEHMRTWKWQVPIKVIDKLKSYLQSQMTGAEWEVLDGRDFQDDHTNLAGDVVPVADLSTQIRGQRFNEAFSHDFERDARKPKGTTGWTKLKPR